MTIQNETYFDFSGIENLMFGQRVAYIIEMKGISKSWVAEKLGISKQALNYLLKYALKPKYIDEFAELLEIDPEWIESGKGSPTIRKPIQNSKNRIVVLQKSAFIPAMRQHPSSKEFIEYTCDNNKDYIFAYKLLDDSNFPPFVPNSMLIFDFQRSVRDGDYVLIFVDNDVFVRQYVVDGNNICYRASCIQHKTYINPDAKIIGVLLEARYMID